MADPKKGTGKKPKGSGIRFKTGVYLDLTTTDSVTIGYTG